MRTDTTSENHGHSKIDSPPRARGWRSVCLLAATALLVCLPGMRAAQAAPLSLAQSPLFLTTGAAPNIMFTLDDSGSMHWEGMPDDILYAYYVFPRANGIYGGGDYTNYTAAFATNNRYAAFLRSSDGNIIYYNPAIRYRPWLNYDGTSFPNATPTAALHNPANAGAGSRDLTVDNTQTARWLNDDASFTNESRTFYPATYFRYNGGDPWDPTNYTRIEIKAINAPFTGSAARTDCAAAPSCTYAEEIQNFANWYTYYRSRVLAARAGIGRAFALTFSDPSTTTRVGFSSINQGSTTIDGVTSPGAVIRGVRPFTGTDRQNFFSNLYNHVMPTSGTPLRRALDDVGRYFERTDNQGPWAKTPGTSNAAAHLTCRQSYNILMTDGYWNGAAASTAAAQANVDNSNGPVISKPSGATYQYTPTRPYMDSWGDPNPAGGTLADIAMYYWNRDLRPDLDNEVPPNAQDPAFWQHLVNFTVGLGVTGTLDPATDLAGLESGALNWPMPSSGGTDENIDDLWHAALNSRGGFFSAADPEAFADALSNSLTNIVGRTASAAAVAVNAHSVSSDTRVYQVRFNSQNWSGNLVAFQIAESGGSLTFTELSPTAADRVNAQDWQNTGVNPRHIITRANNADLPNCTGGATVTEGGVAFDWGNLSGNQQCALNLQPSTTTNDGRGQDRLNYLRGDASNEGAAATDFRNRGFKLGDFVNSRPLYVGTPPLLPDLHPTILHNDFRNDHFNRKPMVYVGGNDGMLHGFDAITLKEKIAYVPSMLFGSLNELTKQGYNHRYYVDGSPVAADVIGNFSNGCSSTVCWRTVLVGGLGGGGKGLYALDITDPEGSFAGTGSKQTSHLAFSESNAADTALWEFPTIRDDDGDSTFEADPDLGYTYGEPVIVRVRNDENGNNTPTWAVIFGNGYNSDYERAYLYIVNAINGKLIRKIMLPDPSLDPSATPATPPATKYANGLSAPAVVDQDGDFIADYVFAGDLVGNMWKVDLRNNSKSNWGSFYKSGSTPKPLYTAKDGTARLPITQRPEVSIHLAGIGGYMVYFGTGRYLVTGDNSPTTSPVHAFHGVWDKNTSASQSVTGSQAVDINRLLSQTISETTLSGRSVRTVTANTIAQWGDSGTSCNPSSSNNRCMGWITKLRTNQTGSEGERSVTNSVLIGGEIPRVVFTTLIPSDDPCRFGGTGWLMELDMLTGGQLPEAVLDIDGDGVITAADKVGGNTPVGGVKFDQGIPSGPVVIDSSGGCSGPNCKGRKWKIESLSSGDITGELNTDPKKRGGRQSWRQLK